MRLNVCYTAPLSQSIQKAYNALTDAIVLVPPDDWRVKYIHHGKHIVSLQDLIAYQIGWGKLLIYWYDEGVLGHTFVMPKQGFAKWDYAGLAHYFYANYGYANMFEQHQEFRQTVQRILEISEAAYVSGDLDAIGVWAWCRLASGKEWPLSKWIQVNTVAPYKRALSAIKKAR